MGIDLTTLQGYSDLLKEGGISTEVQPASKISAVSILAQLKVRDESLESLDKKLAQLQAIKEPRASEETSTPRPSCSREGVD